MYFSEENQLPLTLSIAWWAATAKFSCGGSSGDPRGGRHFYTPVQYGGMLVKTGTWQYWCTFYRCDGIRDWVDASLYRLEGRWALNAMVMTIHKMELFYTGRAFPNEQLREQCCSQQDKAQNKNTWFIIFKDVARKPPKSRCLDDPFVIPDFINSSCHACRLKLPSVWLSMFLS